MTILFEGKKSEKMKMYSVQCARGEVTKEKVKEKQF